MTLFSAKMTQIFPRDLAKMVKIGQNMVKYRKLSVLFVRNHRSQSGTLAKTTTES